MAIFRYPNSPFNSTKLAKLRRGRAVRPTAEQRAGNLKNALMQIRNANKQILNDSMRDTFTKEITELEVQRRQHLEASHALNVRVKKTPRKSTERQQFSKKKNFF